MPRILVVGDFSMRQDTSGVGSQPPIRVDRDDLDAAIAKLAPEVRVDFGDAADPVLIRPRTMDDFHPDRLIEIVAPLRDLGNLRAGTSSSSAPPPPPRPAKPTASTTGLLDGGSLLDQILGGESTAGTSRETAPPRDELSNFIQQAVRPHLASLEPPDQAALKAKVDEVRQAMLRVIVHDARFQAAESAWRSVSFLTRRLDTDEDLQLRVFDISRDALATQLTSDPSGLAKRLGQNDLVVALMSFGAEGLDVLGRLAALGRSMKAPWIAGASPLLVSDEDFGEDADEWTPKPGSSWTALRRSADAQWIGLAIPRFMLRLPYGKASDECERIKFEEFPAGAAPSANAYLWGSGAIPCALVAAEALVRGEPATHGTVDNLPLYIARVGGVPTATPCTEVLLTQRVAMSLLDAGLTPLMAQKDGDAVRIPRLQSIATPAKALAFSESGS